LNLPYFIELKRSVNKKIAQKSTKVTKKLRLVCKARKIRAKYRLLWLASFSHHHRTKAKKQKHSRLHQIQNALSAFVSTYL
jgi:hypothetical protein